jgi:hypothetical protein
MQTENIVLCKSEKINLLKSIKIISNLAFKERRYSLQVACTQLSHYPRLTHPATDVAKEAKQTCQKYSELHPDRRQSSNLKAGSQ